MATHTKVPTASIRMDPERAEAVAAAGAILGTTGLTATVDAALAAVVKAAKRRKLIELVRSGRLDFEAISREDA